MNGVGVGRPVVPAKPRTSAAAEAVERGSAKGNTAAKHVPDAVPDQARSELGVCARCARDQSAVPALLHHVC